MTRITNNIIINDFMKNYNRSKNKLNDYMNQLATGKKFSQISDSSLDAVKALKLKSSIKFNNMYKDNAEDGISWLETTDLALNDVVKSLRKIRDIAVQGANGTYTAEQKEAMAIEVDQLRKHLIELGNTKYGDLYIFNGSKTKVKPYQDDNSNIAGNYENVAVSEDKLNREVADKVSVDINVSGREVKFEQMFAQLYDLQTHLTNDDTNAIANDLTNIDQNIEDTLALRARVGARQQRLEMVRDRLESREINYTDILSKTEDVDMAETITKLKNEENIYRTALATGARIIQPSLIDFLR